MRSENNYGRDFEELHSQMSHLAHQEDFKSCHKSAYLNDPY